MRSQCPTYFDSMTWPQIHDLAKRLDHACDTIAAEFFEGSGDICAVSQTVRDVVLRRLEFIHKHGKSAE